MTACDPLRVAPREHRAGKARRCDQLGEALCGQDLIMLRTVKVPVGGTAKLLAASFSSRRQNGRATRSLYKCPRRPDQWVGLASRPFPRPLRVRRLDWAMPFLLALRAGDTGAKNGAGKVPSEGGARLCPPCRRYGPVAKSKLRDHVPCFAAKAAPSLPRFGVKT